MQVISDHKLQVADANLVLGHYFLPDVVSTSDYYPYGMEVAARSFSAGGYRYGFQGQETDDEFLGGAVSYKYRVHDARIGRFLSRDPLAPEYPFYSPYAFSGNRVIDMVELEGLEPSRHPHDARYIEGTSAQEPGEFGATLTYAVQSPGKNGVQVEGTSDQGFWIREVVNPSGQAGSSYYYSDFSNNLNGDWVKFRNDETTRQNRKGAAINFQKAAISSLFIPGVLIAPYAATGYYGYAFGVTVNYASQAAIGMMLDEGRSSTYDVLGRIDHFDAFVSPIPLGGGWSVVSEVLMPSLIDFNGDGWKALGWNKPLDHVGMDLIVNGSFRGLKKTVDWSTEALFSRNAYLSELANLRSIKNPSKWNVIQMSQIQNALNNNRIEAIIWQNSFRFTISNPFYQGVTSEVAKNETNKQ